MVLAENGGYLLCYYSYFSANTWYDIRQRMIQRAEETHNGALGEAAKRKALRKADEMMLRACEEMFKPLLAEHLTTYDFMKRLDCNGFGLSAKFVSSETLEWTIKIPPEWVDALTEQGLRKLDNGLFGFIHAATVYEQTCYDWMFWWRDTMPKQLIPEIGKAAV